jgi:thiamine-phosphate pyrophosphorylase
VIRLYLVTDRRLVSDLPSAVRAALSGIPPGTAAVQLREKDLPAARLLDLARQLVPICRAASAPLLVNDRADVALAAGADGVHLPSQGIPVAQARSLLGRGKLVGASCHTPAEIADAHAADADFALFGPVWDSPGKIGQGLAALKGAVRASPLPVLAIGGVTPETARLAIDAGAAGVACIRAVLAALDPAAAARDLHLAMTTD